MNIIRDKDFIDVAKSVKVDSKRRIVLPPSLVKDDVTFHIYTNSAGQIVLDPQVTIPVSELWIFQNPHISASLKKGLEDAAEGKISKIDLKSL